MGRQLKWDCTMSMGREKRLNGTEGGASVGGVVEKECHSP